MECRVVRIVTGSKMQSSNVETTADSGIQQSGLLSQQTNLQHTHNGLMHTYVTVRCGQQRKHALTKIISLDSKMEFYLLTYNFLSNY